MRIIGGRWRGTRLPVADAQGLRPTSDRARETLFNWLQPMLPGARVLDLFAGSGALGLESLSRGASKAILVERDPSLCASLRATASRLQGGDAATVLQSDALAFLRSHVGEPFDIAFVDPPFAEGLWDGVLAALPTAMAAGAWLYVESTPQRNIEPGEGWLPHREGHTRDARHALYRRAG
ncbi:MAG: 16S rRNA (guanine(966)-N(2))-methyltransferase RsmD [Luteimonas sp.]|nr:16S rRNA (guanine(966)-N(2))-methyltransferase RsmD [Luteimonas sp.]